MSTEPLGPGPRTRVRRLAKKASYDEATIFAILDEAWIAHVAATVRGKPCALPTLHLREANTLYLHGSPSNEILKSIARAGEAFVTVTIFDGIRVARSGFESSIAYRSVVVVGEAHEVLDHDEKRRLLDRFVDRVLPGRAGEARPVTESEQRLTLLISVRIDEAAAKISHGETDDDLEDQSLPVWAGTIPARLVFGEPVPDTRGAMTNGEVEVPRSVRTFLDDQ
ncbi:MAG TPA: pyridoxamine 5'-phosphate oxidase family protein [Acidimicrobiales bacterium]|nr:pyridoxamine 5'-phosphate oxidase family protein [Acidimicrobiales bacterium]